MEIITAIENEKIARKIRENSEADIIGTDIQYQEAVIEILEKNKNIKLLILSSLLPGELGLYEFINIIRYKNPKLEIIIILEKENKETEQFLISKGINNIYYNNKTTLEEISKKINEINNKNKLEEIENKRNNLEKIILQKNNLNKIKNKINYFKNIKNKKNIKINKNKTKIISIIGAPKVGKTIFSLFLSLNIKNKKILIITLNKKNDMEIILGKNKKNIAKKEENIFIWNKKIEIMSHQKDNFYKNILKITEKNMENLSRKYDYIIIDYSSENEESDKKRELLKKSDKIVLLVEANLLGINETKEILQDVIYKQKIQKDNIKIVFNKQTTTSIKSYILKKMFMDFEILGQLQYDKYYNFFINTNAKYIMRKIQKQFLKITEKII